MKLFAYGTLQPVYADRNPVAKLLVDSSTGCETDSHPGTMYNIGGRYPGVVFGGDGVVYGCTYTIPDDAWVKIRPMVDQYECAPGLYRYVEIADGVYSYEFVHDGLIAVPGGVWV